jgi:N-glycosylase/DNA lyase
MLLLSKMEVVKMNEQKKALKQLINEKGEKEAFKSVMLSAMKSYKNQYSKMDIDTLTDQAWRFTIDYYKDLKVKLPEGVA